MFKYNLGDTVWYMLDSKLHTAKIGARMISEVDKDFQSTRQGNNWNPKLLYGTVHGNWREDQLFRDADAILYSLKKNTVVG